MIDRLRTWDGLRELLIISSRGGPQLDKRSSRGVWWRDAFKVSVELVFHQHRSLLLQLKNLVPWSLIRFDLRQTLELADGSQTENTGTVKWSFKMRFCNDWMFRILSGCSFGTEIGFCVAVLIKAETGGNRFISVIADEGETLPRRGEGELSKALWILGSRSG